MKKLKFTKEERLEIYKKCLDAVISNHDKYNHVFICWELWYHFDGVHPIGNMHQFDETDKMFKEFPEFAECCRKDIDFVDSEILRHNVARVRVLKQTIDLTL